MFRHLVRSKNLFSSANSIRRLQNNNVYNSRPKSIRATAPFVRFYSEGALDMSDYHQISDETLETMFDSYEELAETIPEIDIELSQGVLTLIMPPNGTYVVNKQPPNQQIWLSSPLSGPKRYDYVNGKWTYLRDSSTLGQVLKDETRLITQEKGVDDINLAID